MLRTAGTIVLSLATMASAACALEAPDDAASRVTTSDELRTAAGQTNAGAITAVAPNYGQIPAFKLPFQCGEQWRLSTHGGLISGHRNVETEADFFRVDGGVDFGISHTVGNPVLATASGIVHQRIDSQGGLEIDHGGGWFTLYLHMTGLIVNQGDRVYAGQQIGVVGSVGVDHAHLHYELMFDGLQGPVDGDGDSDDDDLDETVPTWFDGTQYRLAERAPADDPRATSTNACAGGGGAQSGIQFGTNYVYPYRDAAYFFARETGSNGLIFKQWNGSWTTNRFGDTLAGNPAVANFNSQLHVVARTSDNRLRHRWYDPVTASWGAETFPGTMNGDPDISPYALNGQLQVVARDGGNHLFQWWFTHGQGWQQGAIPNSSDIAVAGTPALATYSVKTPWVVAPDMGDFQVVARAASDGALWMWSYDSMGGTGWQRTKTPGVGTSDPAVVVFNNQFHIFVRGTDNKLVHMFRTPATAWSSESLSVLPAGTPAAVVRRNELHVFVRTTANALVDCWWAGSWRCDSLPGQISGDPKAMIYQDPFYTGSNNPQLQVAARGTDGVMWHWWAGVGEAWGRESFGVSIAEPGTSAPPPPPPTCAAPTNPPTTKSWINIFTTAIGRSGTSSSCPQVGQSFTDTNPQYVFCRRWGEIVSDSSGNFNHYWLWTDLDTGGKGWISAYYIADQGNDQANGIPDCP